MFKNKILIIKSWVRWEEVVVFWIKVLLEWVVYKGILVSVEMDVWLNCVRLIVVMFFFLVMVNSLMIFCVFFENEMVNMMLFLFVFVIKDVIRWVFVNVVVCLWMWSYFCWVFLVIMLEVLRLIKCMVWVLRSREIVCLSFL